MLAKIVAGVVEAYPYSREQLAADVAASGADDGLELCLPADLAEVDLSEFGVVRVEPADPPSELGKVAEPDGIEEFAPGQWRQAWTLRDATPDEFAAAKADVAAAVRARRWQAEIGGASVGEVTFRTDETSQGKIAGAVALFDKDETLETIDFEAQPGIWVSLDQATMTAIGIALGRHIQACFSNARVLAAAIDAAETFAALASIDIEEGWPT